MKSIFHLGINLLMIHILPIRAVKAHDLSHLRQICLPNKGWKEEDFQIFFDNSLYYGFAAQVNQSKVVGIVDLLVAVENADIYTLCVLPEYRRKGIGRKLLTWACLASFEKGVRGVFVEVAEGNTHAQHLYGSFGFEAVARRKGYYARAFGEEKGTALVQRLDVFMWKKSFLDEGRES